MKPDISIGAYGWCHEHWNNVFYPPDLPMNNEEDWRLSYYSNEFDCVVIPADYWVSKIDGSHPAIDCESWLDDVHEDFQFYVEYSSSMSASLSVTSLAESLCLLQPQLSALLILDDFQSLPEVQQEHLFALSDNLGIDVIANTDDTAGVSKIWQQHMPQLSDFAFIESDLNDLRQVRNVIEDFVQVLNRLPENEWRRESVATMIVAHPEIQASDLAELRKVLEIMGF